MWDAFDEPVEAEAAFLFAACGDDPATETVEPSTSSTLPAIASTTDGGCRSVRIVGMFLTSTVLTFAIQDEVRRRAVLVSRYDIGHVEIYASAHKHGIDDLDIAHAVDHALATGEQDDGKVLHLGPDRAGNLLEVVSVLRDDRTEIVIHAMRMRRTYESFLRDKGDTDG